MEENEITTIRINKNVKDRLDSFGNKGDSYEDIIKRLMDIAEEKRMDFLIGEKSKEHR